MKKIFLFCLLLSSVLFIWSSCGTEKKEKANASSKEMTEIETEEKASIGFEKKEVVAYPDAIIEMYSPLGNENFKEGKVPFEFNIKNYPFDKGMKNFRLRLTINGNDPIGYHMPIFKRELKTGTYKAVAYLIDQEGLALKEYGNYVDRDFTVGESQPFPVSEEPFMVLNLPDNEQVYQKGEEVLIDFLLIGGGLEEDNMKFVVEVNDQEHEMTDLAPLMVKNLPSGEHEVTVKLVKQNGEELEGIFTSAKRKITIE